MPPQGSPLYLPPLENSIWSGRLSLESGEPVPNTDKTGISTVYWVPYNGNRFPLYDGSRWRVYNSSELSVAVPSTTTTPFDVFVYDSSGTLTLETVNWTNDTTRATALTFQDGLRVQSGATNKLYLGTGRTTGVSGECEDSAEKRFLWNEFNRITRYLYRHDNTDSWTYSTASYRAWNNSSTNRVEYVSGCQRPIVSFDFLAITSNSSGNAHGIGIGIDSTTVNSAGAMTANSNSNALGHVEARYRGYPSLGYHYAQMLEYGQSSGTTTFYGDAGFSIFKSALYGWMVM